jgi:hypothetical protein
MNSVGGGPSTPVMSALRAGIYARYSSDNQRNASIEDHIIGVGVPITSSFRT